MNTFERIQNDINNLKELNMEAGNQLHDQFLRIVNSDYSTEEASTYLKGEYDVCVDFELDEDSSVYNDARTIQDSIINFNS